ALAARVFPIANNRDGAADDPSQARAGLGTAARGGCAQCRTRDDLPKTNWPNRLEAPPPAFVRPAASVPGGALRKKGPVSSPRARKVHPCIHCCPVVSHGTEDWRFSGGHSVPRLPKIPLALTAALVVCLTAALPGRAAVIEYTSRGAFNAASQNQVLT